MKPIIKLSQLIAVASLAMSCSSCSLFGLHTTGEVTKTQTKAYQRGLADGAASEVRAQVHRDQLEREAPPAPLEKKYYQVPMEGYQTPDGLWIESHKATIEVVQP